MNKRILVSILVFGFAVVFHGCQKQVVSGQTGRFTSLAEVKALFTNPPMEYRTAPFWVWHDKVSKKEIDLQLEDFKSKGIGGVFIHPRYGLITEYLSDEWFDLIQYAVAKAQELGMHVWIYDENSFPSGFAGGHVPAQMPESWNKGQGLLLEKANHIPADSAAQYAVILKKAGDSYVTITDPASETGQGDYYLFKLTFYEKTKWYAGYSYVDLIYPGVTEKFIDITMSGYEKSVGAEFGKTVRGVFTDEPNISTPGGENCMRWTPDLFERFRERWGYDLKTNLPSLFEETGDWRHVRHNYYATLLELFINRWSKPWYKYTQAHDLDWTGHYWEHGWPSPQEGSDNMAMYAWHQQPAIDALFNTYSDQGDQFGNTRIVKELSSVVNQLDRHRALSETYGAAGWELSFEDMKRLGDWEYVLGVNFMNQHLSYMTLMGDRKHDFPQSFSYHAPWWDSYKSLADYYARLSLALSSGQQVNRILVLEPTTSAWMYYSPSTSHKRFREIGNSFRDFINTLEKYQIEYDLGCENIIQTRGKVKDGKWLVGQRAYDIVVFPPGMDNIDTKTFSLCQKFLDQGGKILSFERPAGYIDGQKSNDYIELGKSYYASRWQEFDTLNKDARALLAEPDIAFDQPEKCNGYLFHQRRVFADGQLLFLVNSSLEKACIGKFQIKGANVQELDALTGVIKPYPAQQNGDLLTISYSLPPANSLLLAVSNTGTLEAIPAPVTTASQVANVGGITIKRLKPNALTLDYCTLKTGGQVYENIYFYTASFKIFQQHGLPDNPWVSSSQYKTELLDKDTFAADTGFEAVFPFVVDGSFHPEGLRAVVERPGLFKVAINDQPLQPLPNEWALDRSFGVYDLSGLVKPGVNTITVSCKPMSIHAELEPVYLLGEFGLQSTQHGWKLVKPETLNFGSWKEQGLPFYADGVAYSKTFSLSSGFKYTVNLNKWVGSVASVQVNGADAGIIGWQPYTVDISSLVKDGENQVTVVVYGTLKNLLGPHHNVRNRGIVTPWSFKYAPDIQPQGADYDLLAYGLLNDFQLLAIK
ncbi:MAG TPA: glycosyl hydrolase [bacterium]|nr:glycosyl hydrolase [bacterium]HPN43468.1 glycosyl hydrolase [bacterium]